MATYHVNFFDGKKETYSGDISDLKNHVREYLKNWMEKGDYISWYKGDGSYFAVVLNRNSDDTDTNCSVKVEE